MPWSVKFCTVACGLELLPGVCEEVGAVPACTNAFRKPAALYVKDEAFPPPNVATILPSAERFTAACANPESVVCATGLALVVSVVYPFTFDGVTLETVVMAAISIPDSD